MSLPLASHSHKERGGRALPGVGAAMSPDKINEIYVLDHEWRRTQLGEMVAGLAGAIDADTGLLDGRSLRRRIDADPRLQLVGTFESCQAVEAGVGNLVDRLCAAAVAAGADPLPPAVWAELRQRIEATLVAEELVPGMSIAVVTTAQRLSSYQIVLLRLGGPGHEDGHMLLRYPRGRDVLAVAMKVEPDAATAN